MTILTRYIRREIYLAAALVLVAFLSLFMFFDMLQELDEVGEHHYSFIVAFGYIVLIAAGRIYELLPIAVLIGALYALSRFAARSEYTVIRVSGLSTRQAILMTCKIGLPLVLLTFIFGEFISPATEKLAQEIKSTALDRPILNRMRSGFWIRDGQYIVNIGEIQPDRTIRQILLYEFGDHFQLKSIRMAEKGVFSQENGWRLENVKYTVFQPNHVVSGQKPTFQWPAKLDAAMLSVASQNPDRMTALKLFEYSQHLKENRENANRYRIAFWKKLVYPLACLVMMILALPIAYQQQRANQTSLSLFIGILMGVTFYLMNSIVSSLGILNAWPASLVAALPTLIFLLGGCTALWYAERH